MAHVLAQDLRDAVLQAALKGKLTNRKPTDASLELLKEKIKADKLAIMERKNARKDNLKGIITDEELLIECPPEWGILRLGEIGVFKKGPFGSALTKSIFVPKGEDTIKVYEQKNAIQKDHKLGNYYIKKDYYLSKMKGFTVEPGDIIVSCAGTIGESYVMPKDIELGIINQALMRMTISESINLQFFLLYFDFVLKSEAQEKSKGGAIKNIPPFDILKNMPVPIPSFDEQTRIVSRVEELMTKIDEYEKLENQHTELKKKFPKEMKASILQAGISGGLTAYYDDDEDINDYSAIVLAEERVCSKKDITEPDDGNYPFDIPDNWKWLRLNNVVLKEIKRGKSPKYAANGSALAFAQKCNSKYTDIRLDLAKSIDDSTLDKYSEIDNMVDCDIVVNSTGGGTLGRVGLYRDSFNTEDKLIYPDSHVTIIRAKKSVNALYLYYCMKYYSPLLETLGEGSTNQTELKPTTLKNLYIPIPPLSEQKRIVEKLNALLPLCDNLSELA